MLGFFGQTRNGAFNYHWKNSTEKTWVILPRYVLMLKKQNTETQRKPKLEILT